MKERIPSATSSTSFWMKYALRDAVSLCTQIFANIWEETRQKALYIQNRRITDYYEKGNVI